MADKHDKERRDGVSPKTDDLASTLMGDALDLLAAGEDLGVLLAIGDDAGQVASYRFTDDGDEELLAAMVRIDRREKRYSGLKLRLEEAEA